ncbi:hypothetical protein Q8A67_010832 [Cirrhinus molitorella]|uniref:Uncharacterized protein n=1 Tax=Cirrhinus molitorella TaxID=172907 RepID=A0AA88PQS4_9TELE|nr:hypothetical protein Q8A67_010832 [Cirrhinus molitorella]
MLTETAARTALKSSVAVRRFTRGEGKLPLTRRHLQATLFYLTSLCRWGSPSGGGRQTLAINHCINLAQRENPSQGHNMGAHLSKGAFLYLPAFDGHLKRQRMSPFISHGIR